MLNAIADRGKYTCIPAFLLFVVCAIYLGVILFRWFRARHWIETDATLVSIYDSETNGSDANRLGRQNKIKAQYEFSYQGTRYKGRKVSTGLGYRPQLYRDLVSAFSDGERITIYFDPSNPSQSIVDRSFYWPEFIVLAIVGLIGLVVSLWTLPWVSN